MAEKTVALMALNGMQVSVGESKVAARLLGGYRLLQAAEEGGKDGGPYAGLKVDGLKAEVAKRNEGRVPDAQLSATGNKADLVAALEADDKASAEL